MDLTSTGAPYDDEFTTDDVFTAVITKAPIPMWSIVVDHTQLVLTFLGIFANFFALVTLLKNGKFFQPGILLLLQHQAFIDMLACLFGVLQVTLPPMWLTGAYTLDIIICQAWHGQAIYWGTVWVSIWNLVVIAYERYLAVCKPFKHQDFSRKKISITILLGYPLSLAFTYGAYLQTKLSDGSCVSEFFFGGEFGKRFMMAFAVSTFLTFYIIPVIMFAVFYGMVIFVFRKRSRQSNLANSRVIDSATMQLTRTAIIVTLIFIVTVGFDLWYYLLGYTELVPYKVNSPVQKIGVLFAMCNSVANPFVYALLMPAYRKSVMRTVCCYRNKGVASRDASQSTSTV